jgi:glycosyltransferase involved in cell wall biosynthesis
MRISVVIPCYNEESMIGPCLASLLAQTRKADEIIVVNNNSRDASVTIARIFGVTILHETKQGIVHARNTGFNAAAGDLIVRCDADTRFLPDYLRNLEKLAEHSSADAFTGPCFFYDRNFGRLAGLLHRPLFFGISRMYQGHHTLFGSNSAIRRSMWKHICNEVCTIGDHVFHEDVDLALHIARVGGNIEYSNRILSSISARRMKHSLHDLYYYVKRWITTMQYHALPTRSTPKKAPRA